MNLVVQALRGAQHSPPQAVVRLAAVLVVGAGGVLGSALLAEALVAGRFSHVRALVAGPLRSALRGLEPWPASALSGDAAEAPADTAFIVFERGRHSNGRDDAFVLPQPAELLPLATALRRQGVQRLLVVVPHAPALLPGALKAGLATLDEAAVAALGFEHLVFIRAAQDGVAVAGGTALERFGRWWMSQLRWMVPQREQPVRAVRLAALAVELARLLPQATPGTRVVPPELLSQAAAADRPEALLADWLGLQVPTGQQ